MAESKSGLNQIKPDLPSFIYCQQAIHVFCAKLINTIAQT